MSFDLYHSHKSLVSWESTGPRSARYEESLSHLSRHPSRWAIAGQREQVSQAQMWAPWWPHPQNDRTEIREDREVERFQERERENGKGDSVVWMRELRPPEAREAERTDVGDSEQEVEAAACHTQGNHVRCPRGAQIFSLSRGHAPCWAPQNVTNQSCWPPPSIKIDQRPDWKFRKGLIGAPAAAEGSKDKQQFPLLAPWKKPTFNYLGI